MKDRNHEPQLWDEKNDGEDDTPLPILGIIVTLVFFVLGIFFGMYISNKKHSEETSLRDQQVRLDSNDPGNFVILENNTTSITFNRFEGELVWYVSDEGNHFYPTGYLKIENQKPIQVPKEVRAFLKKGKALGESYSMDVIHTR